jgi:putative salt-induced outer membrane protein YdiY
MAKVQGITTQTPLHIQLPTGDRPVATMNYSPEGRQTIAGATVENKTIDPASVQAMWNVNDDSPEVAATKALVAKWSLRVEAGLDGQTGNTEQVAIHGRAEAKRIAPSDRFALYVQGNHSKSNESREIIGGTNIEVDFNDHFFTYGKLEVENDKTEKVDLRTTISGGLGYFFLKEADQEFKARLGAGFLHESFNDDQNRDADPTNDIDPSSSSALAEAGWDYMKKFSPHLQFNDHFTIYMPFDDTSDWRAVLENAFEFPLSGTDHWKLRTGMRNQYDSLPLDGIDRLDTSYFMNMVYDFK